MGRPTEPALNLHDLTVRQIDAEETLTAAGHLHTARTARYTWKIAANDDLERVVTLNEKYAHHAAMNPQSLIVTENFAPPAWTVMRADMPENERHRRAVD